MTYIGAVFPVQLTRDTSQISKWGQTRLGCVYAAKAQFDFVRRFLVLRLFICTKYDNIFLSHPNLKWIWS